MKDKKVLITGGLGFIGSNLAHACCKLGAQVTILDAFSPNSGANKDNIQEIRNDIELVEADIRDFEKVIGHVKGKDIIFNCAASTSHSLSMKEPWEDMDANGRGVLNLLEAVRQHNRTMRFVQVGTTTQIGAQTTACADEMHPEFPMDIYSAHKSLGEKYTLIYGRAYDMFVSVVRLPNVYGPRAAINNRLLTFNNYFVGLALQGKDITVYGDGAQKRNILYVDDAVNGLITAALNDKAGGEVFFCTGDEHFSVGQIAQMTVDIFESGQVKFIPWPSDPSRMDVGHVCLSNAKIKKTLGWAPRMDFKTGLLKTKDYYADCLGQYLN